jgi:broad specificity phosphatase PhoE
LSETGELQAAALREFFGSTEAVFDEVWSGSLERHRRTAELAVLSDWPALRISPDWNEYDATGIIRAVSPPPEAFADNRTFQKMLEAGMEAWMSGTLGGDSHDGYEPWPAFRDRVRRALRSLQEGPSSRRVIVFTSGGPIGMLVQQSLAAPENSFLAVNWRVKNASITEFTFSRDRLSLDGFNNVSHLEPALRTYR